MAWIWTDDLARLLMDRRLVEEHLVREWLRRPTGVAVEADADPIEVALSALGIDPGGAVGAA
jgi:hypothetical protein